MKRTSCSSGSSSGTRRALLDVRGMVKASVQLELTTTMTSCEMVGKSSVELGSVTMSTCSSWPGG